MFHKESRPFGQELMCEYQDEVKSQGGEEITVNFDVKLVEVFQEGLEVDVYEYPDGYCRLVHLAYETARHEVDANKFMPHPQHLGFCGLGRQTASGNQMHQLLETTSFENLPKKTYCTYFAH